MSPAATPSAIVHRWTDLPADTPMPKMLRRKVVGKQMMISHVALTAGFKVPSHHHASEQLAVVISGTMKFGLGTEGTPAWREVIVTAGQVVELPGDFPHSAEAIEDSILLDVFSPPMVMTGVDKR